MIRAFVTLMACLLLAACSTGGGVTAPSGGGSGRAASTDASMNTFSHRIQPRGVRRSNNDIALEFIDLTFSLESGQRLSRFTRFDGPITVAFTATPPRTAKRDLENVIARMRSEAGLDIRVVNDGTPANIRIDRVSSRRFKSVVSGAACFVVPNVKDFADLKKNISLPRTDWARIARRTKAAIIMPDNISAQETRDCIHEELAQALGPLNDLYRVGDSVYNDDNFHVSLTPYDMLILRAVYSPVLQNGMTRTEVAERIRPLLAQINPAGQGARGRVANKTKRSWAELIEKALGPTGAQAVRIETMSRAINEARALRYNDNRLAFAYYARARLRSSSDAQGAAEDYARAYDIYSGLYGTNDIHAAKLSVQIASLAFSNGELGRATAVLDSAIPAAQRAEDAATLFKLLALKAEIAEFQGDQRTASQLRRQGVGWGKYGLASDREIAQVLALVKTLRPKPAL